MRREMSVAGSFYPETASEIERYFEHFNKLYSSNFKLPNIKTKAIIVPHAGYIYSGYTANIAYKILQNSGIKKFVVIGPSHRVAFEGVSLCSYESYQTPFGDIKSEDTIVEQIDKKFSLRCYEQAHAEHSTEVQFPFLKYYIPDVEIVELVYSKVDSNYMSKIIDFILKNEDIGVVISTDLSHFYNLEDANRLDFICLDAIKNLDLQEIELGCEACGIVGLKAMLESAKKSALIPKILDYKTSADASGDKNRVVGYVSACFV